MALDPEALRARRSEIGRLGAAARLKAPPEELLEQRRAAARALNSPICLAQRLGKAWRSPEMDDMNKIEILKVLATFVPGVEMPR